MSDPAPGSVDQNKLIGKRLGNVLRVYDLSQQQFADRIGVARPSLNGYLTGAGRLSLDSALAICDQFSVTLDYLYRGEVGGLTVAMLNQLEPR
jgi:transcriptional regulator with XRE-family HTH domain